MGSVITYYKYLLKKNLLSWRMLSVVIVTMLVLDSFFATVRTFCESTDLKVSQWGFAIMWNNKYLVLCFFLIFIYAIANFPKDRSKERYMIARMGVSKWIYGQVLYIHTFGWIYVFFILVMQNLLLCPVMEWSDKWGSGWAALTDSNMILDNYVLVTVSKTILSNYSPIYATILVIMIMGILLGMLGTLILYLNLYSKVLGTLVASALVFLSLATKMNAELFRYSVINWIQLDCHYTQTHNTYPTLNYIFLVLVMLSVLLVVLAKIRVNGTQENNRRRY